MRTLLSDIQEPRIVLTWLLRLRWLAVAGQVAAVAVAVVGLGLSLPLMPVGAIVAATALSNLLVALRMRVTRPPTDRATPAPAPGDVPAWLVPGVIFLDICLLTLLLFFTGGPSNPFATLYVVHVVMAVVVLGRGWAWASVVLAGVCYAGLFSFHRPLTLTDGAPVGPGVMYAGLWLALVLELALIAYFIGRLARSLRDREQELLAMRDRATRNEQLATLTTLAAGAAHELGTPLGTIAVVAKELELAIDRLAGRDGDLAEDARLIRREVDRCRRILDRMRVDIVRDIAQSARTHTVEELLEHVVQDLPEEDRSRLVVRREPDAVRIYAPLRAVQQAVGVMVRNAFDASPADAAVAVHVHRRDGMIVLEVVDRGSGISADVVRRVGEPFFTTKDPGKGMGLGLFLVRLVAERCNGRWHIESTQGEGTISVLELPEGTADR